MLVAAHQPHFLPWLGYLDRIRKADRFVLLDHVQFERQNYQNRTRILMGSRVAWLTVPVVQKSRDERILDKEIHNEIEGGRLTWARKATLTLEHAYARARFFDRYFPSLRDLLESRWHYLVDLDLALTQWCLDQFEIRTPLLRSSQLALQGRKSELVLNLCKSVGGSAYIGGLGGSRHYLDVAAFAQAGVRVVWQEFNHPTYPQCSATGPAPVLGLSAIDLLFNCGPDSAAILRGEVRPHERVTDSAAR